ncbi:PilC/PilY family type IV pilus protein [Variovorax sp. J22P240]|uniref:pilus assembly protein n=1 Tax=Variovorax sp. J22P240 TaxID=3053514 RepID=UPI0025755D9B|nr:PilC/PilY family type IV pilus protein [Variovorax sp. J22P240]MDM0001279.1 PilC/PilY family type IV pilus protein [Variovorax sp. J22P240]
MKLFENRISELRRAFVAVSLYLAGTSLLAFAAGPPSVPPDAVLSDEPLFSTTSLVKPNMVLDLSVEFPTTGAAYRAAFDIKKSYIGYWDPMGCYDYSTADGFYKRASSATVSNVGIVCSDKWSGNMLNWAASSAIDMLRYAMTGGDRVVDTKDSTVLQRAVLQPNFYNDGAYFPSHDLAGNLDKLTPLVKSGVVKSDGKVSIASCRDRLFVGSSKEGTCDAPGNNQKFGPGKTAAPYNARVEVCSQTEGPVRSDLCLKYPNGNYKPVGTIQTYSDKMRFAAFGYLMDNTNNRYGGVLRAPMKFTGPTAQNERFEKIANEAAEWDARSGVFIVNPLPGEGNSSGVVNYLNQFGRTGSTPGTYKTLDPVGEMYYESLRYLQGQVPTDQAYDPATVTSAMRDGFPVYNKTSKWGQGAQPGWDPVVSSCQRNYVVVIGDLNTHHERSLPGLTTDGLDGWGAARPVGASGPDAAAWAKVVGAFENNETVSYSAPPGRKGTLTTRGNANGPRAIAYKNGAQISSTNIATLNTGSDQGSFGWAGLAYWANTQAIRSDYPDVRVKTYTIDVDEGGNGTIGKDKRGSAFYLAAKYGGFDDKNNDGNPFVTAIGSDDTETISNSEWQSGLDDDGLPKAANYFLASKPAEMIAAIRKIFANAGAASGTIAGGALSSTRIASSGASLYIPQLDSTRWSGSLLAYKLTYDGGAVSRGTTPIWNAGDLLTSGNPRATPAISTREPNTRKIFTMLGSGSGAAFTWGALQGDATLSGHLNAEPYSQSGAADKLGEYRVAYLRGDRTKEIDRKDGIFRTRDSVMGDVVNSTPLLVAAPSFQKGGTSAVYVGANDGMLHAFAADSGEELFAYVPRSIYAKLSAYSSPDYVHQPYVDGSPAAGEVQLANGERKTALVSGMGGGARGVFALDITDPARFSENHVMWEFSGADDADMGYVTQAPRIVKFRTIAASNGRPAVYRWFVVVPSGFNNGNVKKAAALFLLSLDKSASESWQLEKNYYKIVLPDPVDAKAVNALGPVGDYAASDNATRLLYAGDTQGNLWKFDFFAKDAPWNSSTLALERAPLMVARDAKGNRQPITVAPEIGVGPGGGAIVLFGTGKFVEVDDLSSRRQQTLYAVYDNKTAVPADETRNQLQQRTVASDQKGRFTISGSAFVYGNYDGETSQRRGWYFDLPDSESEGERQVSQMVLSDGYLFFNTLIPNPNTCGAGGGGHSCAVNAMTGLSSGSTCIPSTVGLLSSPLVIQAGDGAYSSTDSFGRRIESKKVSVINQGTGTGAGPGVSIDSPISGGIVSQIAGRLNWRQITNFKDVKQ